MMKKLISGGQTGVDRAALDVAIQHNIFHGGWCPAGRKAEDGPIPECYLLQETNSPNYAVRTKLNVRDSDGTLILCEGEPVGGTGLTVDFARELDKSFLVIRLDEDSKPAMVVDWIREHTISVLNVAGPRESTTPGIYAKAKTFLELVFAQIEHF